MFKFRLMAENVAEMVFGRLLPQVEAKAGGCSDCTAWESSGCCGIQRRFRRYCWDCQQEQYKCEGGCPV